MDYSHLKSGTDVRGTALDVLGQAVTLDPAAAAAIARAFFYYMSNKKRVKTVAVGHDPRLSSLPLKEAVAAALVKSGACVLDMGLCSTPAAFMMTKFPETGADLAVMITASHHPKDKNGLKFFDKNGGLSAQDIEHILTLASFDAGKDEGGGVVKTGAFFPLYTAHLRGMIQAALGGDMPLSGLKLAVDAGNGAGGFYAREVLAPLGADVSGSIYLEPDGNFPNHAPNPENKDAMRAISDCVLKNKADLGIIFDTDVDRAAVVGATGREVNRDALIALTAKIVLRDSPGATVVTDSVTSLELADFIKGAGGVHYRYKRGYKNVIDEAIRLNEAGTDAPLAIETSGHAALRENYFLDDGAYLVTRILIEVARLKAQGSDILSLIRELKEPAEAAEIRLTITAEDWKSLGAAAVAGLTKRKIKGIRLAADSREGVRLLIPALAGFIMLRQSVHDPVLVINAQCAKAGGVKRAAALLSRYLRAFSGIDLTPLSDFIS
ncbi:MAG: phosphomannomutase/phosphoglucomutase [Clostridiales bacterium]|jgi:phosphomannomutase|nr:phosphomannomutase/phosphoglucomutase [Clostridiales bacterium]